MMIRRAIIIVLAIVSSVALFSCTSKNVSRHEENQPAERAMLSVEDKSIANIDALCRVAEIDVEQANEAIGELEKRLEIDGYSVIDSELVFKLESKSENERIVLVGIPEKSMEYQVYIRQGRSPIIKKTADESGVVDENWNQGKNDNERRVRNQDANVDLSDQDNYTPLHSTETKFDRSTSINLERGDAAGHVGKEVAESLLQDLNDEVALWGKSIDGPIKVEIGKDVVKDGTTETFLVYVYIDLDKPIFKCVYDIKTLEHSFELMP